MSDRVKGLTVVLDKDYKDEDAEQIIRAIQMIKGVESITTEIVNSDDYMNRERVKSELRDKIFHLLYD